MAKGNTLEENFAAIEKILEVLEDKDPDSSLSLEESFKLYKEGVKLVGQCNSMIDKVEKQIIILEKEGCEDE